MRTVYVWGIDKSCINAATVGFGEDIFQWGLLMLKRIEI